jgi:hypothetical protein
MSIAAYSTTDLPS